MSMYKEEKMLTESDAQEKTEVSDLSTEKTGKRRLFRSKLYEKSRKKDIRYRGPLSYRHFRILGWICIAVSQVVVFMSIAERFAAETMASYESLQMVLSYISTLSLPLLLFASFAVILDFSKGYKMQLLTKGAAAAAVIVFFELFYCRYFAGGLAKIVGQETASDILTALQSTMKNGYLSINLFMDLVLCILFMYFLIYRPQKWFQGKKIIIFRLFALLPIVYECACIILKAQAQFRGNLLPMEISPFLTTKPPIMFILFIILAFYIKNRERRFIRSGGSHLEYGRFLKTRRNSWNFSLFAFFAFVIAGIVDWIASVIITSMVLYQDPQMLTGLQSQQVMNIFISLNNIGIGKSTPMIFFAPLLLLFSYTRSYRNGIVDLIIPIAGVVLVIFVYLEGIYYALGLLPSMGG